MFLAGTVGGAAVLANLVGSGGDSGPTGVCAMASTIGCGVCAMASTMGCGVCAMASAAPCGVGDVEALACGGSCGGAGCDSAGSASAGFVSTGTIAARACSNVLMAQVT